MALLFLFVVIFVVILLPSILKLVRKQDFFYRLIDWLSDQLPLFFIRLGIWFLLLLVTIPVLGLAHIICHFVFEFARLPISSEFLQVASANALLIHIFTLYITLFIYVIFHINANTSNEDLGQLTYICGALWLSTIATMLFLMSCPILIGSNLPLNADIIFDSLRQLNVVSSLVILIVSPLFLLTINALTNIRISRDPVNGTVIAENTPEVHTA